MAGQYDDGCRGKGVELTPGVGCKFIPMGSTSGDTGPLTLSVGRDFLPMGGTLGDTGAPTL